jgi:hypothetical protein
MNVPATVTLLLAALGTPQQAATGVSPIELTADGAKSMAVRGRRLNYNAHDFDCLLHDFRLLKPTPGRGARLVVAERQFGASYADSKSVTFTYSDLKENKDGTMGRPRWWFVPAVLRRR